MKRLIMLLLVSIFLLAACGEKSEQKPQENNKKAEETETEQEQGIEVDKGLLNVEVVLPASLLDEEQDIEQLKAEAKEKGIKEVTVNDDGSVTYKMSKSVHKQWLKESAKELDKSLTDMVESGEFTSIKDIQANKNYSKFTITVDAEAFENSFDGFATLGIGFAGMFFQIIEGGDPEKSKVIINIIDESGEEISTMVFPDDLNEEIEE